jgi:hypothetical protein
MEMVIGRRWEVSSECGKWEGSRSWKGNISGNGSGKGCTSKKKNGKISGQGNGRGS